ncbi:MAG: ATP-binding protein [Phycisphaerae bacterium]
MLTIQSQPRPIAQLQRALHAGRLASTWIFAGPEGVGKFKLAVELAKTRLCDNPQQKPNADEVPTLPKDFPLTLPCNACESCRAIDTRNHPDLHIVTKELIRYHDKTGKSKGTTLSIDVIRGEITGDPAENKEAKIYKRSFRGKGKFFLIDQADLMEAPAQNALLKTLEEPPLESYLVLITTSPQELLSTIRSRAQLVSFQELPDDIIIPHLIGVGMNNEDAALLARLARGSLGRALLWANDIQLIDQKNTAAAERAAKKAKDDDDEEESTNKFTPGGILAWTHELTAALDQLVAGRASASDVAALIAKFAAEAADLHLLHDKLASADRAKRDAIALFMSIAAEWFADRLRHALGTPHPTPLPGITGALDYHLVPKLIATARAAESEIDMNANDKILLAATTTQWEKLLHESIH